MNVEIKTRLSKRLKALLALIPDDVERFYDLYCDHGQLGRAVLELHPKTQVVFNDIGSEIILRLEHLLTALNAQGYELSSEPAEELKITPSGQTTCICLAGVGDELTIKTLQNLFSQPLSGNHRYIISPATKAYYVREYLIREQVYLLDDRVVLDNKRGYEILTICPTDHFGGTRMSSNIEHRFGGAWLPTNGHRQHLHKLLNYYQPKALTNSSSSLEAITAGYQALLKKLTP